VQRAKAFYGSVFGWQTLALEGNAEMWTLPGYGDHLEEKSPNLRKQQGEMGAPVGFEDVVASVHRIARDDPGTPAHWSVTFTVEDADATAAKASELGGAVITQPFDAPWVRMAVLADPGGAAFIVSKFVPRTPDLARPTGGDA
jgi:predicted enzyme related to lactoylglutathione lyase